MIVPYENYTHYSIQIAFSHVDELVQRAGELKLPGIAITDHHSLSGCIEFIQETAKWNKKHPEQKIKPILGCRFNVDFGSSVCPVIVLAKNKKGWSNLIRLLGNSYDKNDQSVISHKTFVELGAGLICILLQQYPEPIGQYFENVFSSNADYGAPIITGSPSYYVNSDDVLYQQIIICSHLKLTMADKDKIIAEHPEYAKFFDGTDLSLKATAADESSMQLLPLIEDYSIQEKPKIPVFKSDKNPDDALADLCRAGWVKRGLNTKLKNDEPLKKIYVDEIKMELDVFKRAKLANYMLVIHDIVAEGRKLGTQVGLRGSAAGCLVSYLIGLSDLDPIMPDPTLPYHPARSLMFSRFYNEGRNSENNISMPDIDVDIGISFRPKLIEYIKRKYGEACVSNIITFGRMDGKGAIKEVFRVLNPVENSFELANIITSYMVDTSKVQDILEDLKEDDAKYNIINYCIDNIPSITEFYHEYKREFDIAIRLGSTIKQTGKHAAGIVITNEPLSNLFPIAIDPKTGSKIVALEMADLEYCGGVKYDFLGVAAYEKLDKIMQMINGNLTSPIVGVEVEEMGEDE